MIGFPIAVVKKFSDDQAGYHVSLLAYYGFVAAFPLLLALTAIVGVVLRSHPKLQEHLVNSAFAEFPIVGGQIHQQLGVTHFGNTLTLTIGILGSLYGARGFAYSLQNTLNTLWAVPKVDWPGFPHRYLRTVATLLMLGLIVVVTGASSAAAVKAASWGFGGWPARAVSFAVGCALGTGFSWRCSGSRRPSRWPPARCFRARRSAPWAGSCCSPRPVTSSPTSCVTPRRWPDSSVRCSGCWPGWRCRRR
ncbi:virulence factor BrkB family protein [Mycobacterium xenopi 4042]|uniref:Virulence factor BrkB family protein n=1 Tax=Mycobacterium xenopi 4042 TaxID=1299334 RepID=X8DKT6_MYCXE|nr:virulence factor BrkB family protein [Mycobacterium xenopi 4042]